VTFSPIGPHMGSCFGILALQMMRFNFAPPLALCRSTINEASEYIIFYGLLYFRAVGFLLGHFRIHSTAKEIAKCGTPHGLVPPIRTQPSLKEVVGIHVLLKRSPFGDGILRSLLPRVASMKSTSALLRRGWLRKTKPQFWSRQQP
jgi:hypothetical protein